MLVVFSAKQSVSAHGCCACMQLLKQSYILKSILCKQFFKLPCPHSCPGPALSSHMPCQQLCPTPILGHFFFQRHTSPLISASPSPWQQIDLNKRLRHAPQANLVMLQLAEPHCCLLDRQTFGSCIGRHSKLKFWLWVCAGECWGFGERPDGGQQFQDHVGGLAR